VNFDQVETRARLLTFLLNRFGIPGDFERRFEMAEQRLVYVLVHLYHVTARLSDSVSETDSKAVIATRKLWYRDELEDYRFAMRAKMYMDPSKVRATVLDADLSRRQADREAEVFGGRLLERDRKRFKEIPKAESIHLEHEGTVYYPLYEIRYQYGATSYRTVFDASNGVVCHAEHPMSLRTRVVLKVSGLVFMAFTAAATVLFILTVATGFGEAMDPVGIGGYGAAALVFLVGLAVGLRILRVALTRRSSAEEIEAPEHPLDLQELTVEMPVKERKKVGQFVS